MIGVGIYCHRHAGNVDAFVLGGRSVGPWLTAFAFGTSYFSAVIFVGYAGQFGWKYGVAATWIGIGNALLGSLLAWVVLGRRTRIMTQHLDSRTMSDFFGLRYHSKALKIAASIISFVFMIPYTASLFNGLSRLFSMAFPAIDYAVCVIVMALLTGIYVIVGGYMATAINDFIQGIIMIIGICAVVVSVLNLNGGLSASLALLSQQSALTDSGAVLQGAYTSFLGPQPLMLLGVVILTSLGTWGLPQMVGKFYAIRNEESVRTGTVISTVFALIVAGGCYFLGGFGRLFTTAEAVTKNGYDSIIPAMLEQLPDVLIAIVLILVLSASMSTLSSLVLTSSSTITLDFLAQIKRKPMKEKSKLFTMRAFVAVFIILSAAIAIVQAKSSVAFIAQLMGVSWGAMAGSFLAPFLYGLFWRRTTPAAVWASFAGGVGITILELLILWGAVPMPTDAVFGFFLSSPINAGVLAMLFGLLIVPIVSLLTKPMQRETVDAMFSCFSRRIEVDITESLGSK